VTNRIQLLVLGLILSGAIGNLYDNFTQPQRAVRDFLLFFHGQGVDRIVFPAFNVADSCITVGAIGLFFLLLREDRASAARKPAVS
jgi:lipoprotein signal peptidase